jgi:hypothetical protein
MFSIEPYSDVGYLFFYAPVGYFYTIVENGKIVQFGCYSGKFVLEELLSGELAV